MQLSIIIVNYQSLDFLNRCLRSLKKNLFSIASPFYFEVIIVNNDSKKLNLNDFKTNFPFKLTIKNIKKNVGFSKANNLAVKIAQGKILFFLNPDTTLVNDDLKKIVRYFAKNPAVGVIGPKIIDAKTGQAQPWTSGKKTNLISIIFRNTIGKSWNKSAPTIVDWVSGTALLVKKNDFKRVGGFDENFFMYFEDQDLCLRIQNLKKVNLFFPLVKIIHHSGGSWKNNQSKKKAFYQSQNYFFKKHHSCLKYYLFRIIRFIFKGV